ncbi:hypothetical protein LEP1GSC170_0005 [Leptospira interrogans serovar Bataviae str. HAI135]|nr:hypothetical protein LEP1GSC170_0005 [Leptospira interrogans serovar Bataviae str. HAI135]
MGNVSSFKKTDWCFFLSRIPTVPALIMKIVIPTKKTVKWEKKLPSMQTISRNMSPNVSILNARKSINKKTD